jgi:hypothetical protein
MFFLLRMAFWLTVVCVLLPSGSKPGTAGPQIDAAQAVTLASAAVSDVRGFCDRQPQACVVGGKVAVALGHKAEAGARTLFQFVTDRLADNGTTKLADSTASMPTGSTSAQRTAHMVPVSTRELPTAKERGTLKAADLHPSWHAPVPLPPRREARASRPSV